MGKTFEKLNAWKNAIELATSIYKLKDFHHHLIVD
jgi:hypothetical protein